MTLDRVTLEGRFVRLEPLAEDHREGLIAAVKDGELWTLFFTLVPHPDEIDRYLAKAERAYEQGEMLPFAIIDKATGRLAGSTRFLHAEPEDKRLEIGATFLAQSFQRTRLNTEAKLLMLTHAFETLGFNRVEFLTDYFNTRSRNAILRLGAKQEGILRNHKIMSDGRVRDSVLFSIIENEWPGVKQNLLYKLDE